ncbi:MAG TPA: outer membrane protein assembly factor BamD, partial [Dissulfurispiraceae bacterium]
EPVLFRTSHWRTAAYRWFRNGDINDVYLAFDDGKGARENKYFKVFAGDDELARIPRVPVEGKCSASERIGNEGIDIVTDCIHKPLLVKVSYHPRWKVEGAARIYRASPSFMLIFPERKNIRMRFSTTPVEYTGIFMSLFALVFIAIEPFLKRKTADNGSSSGEDAPSHGAITTSGWRLRLVLVCVLVLAATALGMETRNTLPVKVYAAARSLFDNKDYAGARKLFGKTMNGLPNSQFAHESNYFLATAYFLEGNYPKALENFRRLLDNFHGSIWTAEAHYYIGLSQMKMHNALKAEESFRLVMDRYPGAIWARYSGERLKELPSQGKCDAD